MHSALADGQAAHAGPESISDLLVLWQNPTDRRFVPIGVFRFDGTVYSFAYTRAAADVTAFRPLPGLPNLRQRYTSARIPAVFSQRVMSPSRIDFDDYVRGLGLDPSSATPWEQIVQSGGTRAGDTLQFMQMPRVENGRARARFFANGVKHIPKGPLAVSGRKITVSAAQHEQALTALGPGDQTRLVREDHNPADPWACLITTVPSTGGSDSARANNRVMPLGWVPRVLSRDIHELLAFGPISCSVVRVGPHGSPSHQRLVLDLNHPAPNGFQFDPSGQWQALADW